MNTILILGNNSTEGKSIVVLLHQWEQSVEVFTAQDEKSAGEILSKNKVNLIICNLNLTDPDGLTTLYRLTSAYPFIPCIAITNTVREAMRYGASYCLQSPFDTMKFLSQITEFLDMETRGSITGIPIHSFLQMMEGESKTCTLAISTSTETGFLYLRNGTLIGAETTELRGEDAVYEILIWEDPTIEIKFLNPRLKQDIDKPLIYFIMEAFRRKDEAKLKGTSDQPPEDEEKLKHIMTSRTPLTLDMGSQMKIELKTAQTPFVSSMVGMLPGKCLMATTPSPSRVIHKAFTNEERLTVRYIHMGRLCMFKTTILHIINRPNKLIFLDYPTVVHYREMRRSKRISTKFPAVIKLKDASTFNGVLKELSATGGLYHIKTKGNNALTEVDILEEISLQFTVPNQIEEQKVSGTVKNMQKNSYEINLGIVFSEPLTHLTEYLEQLEVQRKATSDKRT